MCPINGCKPLSKVFDHHGGKMTIEEHDVTITVPELAVSRGEEVEIQAVASLIGPYKLPDDYYPISVFVWVGADYIFKKPVRITIPHFASIKDLDESFNVAVLTANKEDYTLNENGDLVLQMHKSVYEYQYEVKSEYCDYYTNRFCSKCLAERSFIYNFFNWLILSPLKNVSCPCREIMVFLYASEDYETANKFLIELCICYRLKHCLEVCM